MKEYPKHILPPVKQAENLQKFFPGIGNLHFGTSTPSDVKGELGTVIVVREEFLGKSYVSAVQAMIKRLNTQQKGIIFNYLHKIDSEQLWHRSYCTQRTIHGIYQKQNHSNLVMAPLTLGNTPWESIFAFDHTEIVELPWGVLEGLSFLAGNNLLQAYDLPTLACTGDAFYWPGSSQPSCAYLNFEKERLYLNACAPGQGDFTA